MLRRRRFLCVVAAMLLAATVSIPQEVTGQAVVTDGLPSSQIIKEQTNYCGPGGTGPIKNNVDACCYQHDGCHAGAGTTGPFGEPIFQSACVCDSELVNCLLGINNTLAYDTLWSLFVLGKVKCYTDCSLASNCTAGNCTDDMFEMYLGPLDVLNRTFFVNDLRAVNGKDYTLMDDCLLGEELHFDCSANSHCNGFSSCSLNGDNCNQYQPDICSFPVDNNTFQGTCNCPFPRVGPDCTTNGTYCEAQTVFDANFDRTLKSETAEGICITGYVGSVVANCSGSGAWNLLSGSCVECDKDKYINSNGKCVACPALSTTTGKGKTSINDCTCNAGYIRSGTSNFVCQACPFGQYASSATQCTECPSGKTTATLASTSSDACVCPQNQELSGSSCVACKPYASSEPGQQCACDPGYELDSAGDCIDSSTSSNQIDLSKEVADLATTKNVGSLQGWVNMASGIRESSASGYPPIKDMLETGQYDQSAIFKWMSGAMAIFGICIVFAAVSCCAWPIFCIARCCCGACGADPPQESYTKNQRYAALAVLVVGSVLIFVGAIIGLVSNALLHRGIDGIIDTLQNTIYQVDDLPSEITTTINDVNNGLGNVENLLGNVPNDVGNAVVFSGVQRFIGNISQSLTELSDKFTTMNGLSTSLDTEMDEYKNCMNSLQNKVAEVNANITYLGNNLVTDGSVTYQFVISPPHSPTTCPTSSCLPDPNVFTMNNVTSGIPIFSAAVSALNSIDFSALNDTINGLNDNLLGQNITGTLTAEIDDDVNSVIQQIQDTQNDIMSNVNSSIGQVNSQLQDYSKDIIDIFDNYVKRVEKSRYAVMALLFSLNFLLLFVAILGFFFKKTWVATAAITMGFMFMVCFWVLCALHFIVAVPFGKICLAVSDPQGLLDILPDDFFGDGSDTGNYSVSYYINETLAARKACEQPDGNLVNFFHVLDQYNINDLIDDFLNQTDIAGMIDSFNASDIMGDNVFPNLDLTPQVNSLQQATEDFFVIFDMAETYVLIPMNTSATCAAAQVSSMNSSACLNVTGTPTAMESQTMEAYFNSSQAFLEQQINDILDLVAECRGAADNITTLLNDFNNEVHDSVTLANDLLSIYNNITDIFANYLDSVKGQVLLEVGNVVESIKDFINTSVNEIVGLANCYWIGQDMDALQNSLCILMLGGLDAVWFAAGYLGLFILPTIIGIHLFEKRWLREDEAISRSYMQEVEMETPASHMDDEPPNYDDKQSSMYA